jgi:hypothetical protein
MRTQTLPSALVVAALTLAALAPGCSLFKVKGKGHVKATYNGETLVDKQVRFDSLEELPGAMKELGGAVAQTTDVLIEKLVEAPPPGEVRLADVDPALAQFENDPSVNFLLAARSLEQPIEFKYVRIGVPSYDQFFQKSAELYATMYQTKQTIFNLKALAAKRTGQTQLPTGDLRGIVGSALSAPPPPGALQVDAKLRGLAFAASAVARAARAVYSNATALVSAGQQLVAAAPSSITNPKTVLHLDLIVQGLTESVAMIAEAAELLATMIPELAGF